MAIRYSGNATIRVGDRREDKMSKPHSFMGIPEAKKALRLIEQGTPAALGELQRMAIAMGAASMDTDAATVKRRMSQYANDAIRWHGDGSE